MTDVKEIRTSKAYEDQLREETKQHAREREERERQERAAFLASVRAFADWMERNPGIGIPSSPLMVDVFVPDRETIAAYARMTSWEKGYNEQWMWLRKTFGAFVQFDVNVKREKVCRRVVKGTRVVPARPEETVEDVEWVCDDALLEVK